MSASRPSRWTLIVLCLTFAAAIFLRVKQFFFPASPATAVTMVAPPQATQMSVPAIILRVSQHLSVLPNEVPTVFLVKEPEALQKDNPTFFAHATSNDAVLIWSDKAVLYSPSRDRIIAVQPRAQ